MKMILGLLIFACVPAFASQQFGVVCNNFDGVEKANLRLETPLSLMGCATTPCQSTAVDASKFDAKSFGDNTKVISVKNFASGSVIVREEHEYGNSTDISGYQIEVWLNSASPNPTTSVLYLHDALLVWDGVNGNPNVVLGQAFVGSQKDGRSGILTASLQGPQDDETLLCRLVP